MIARLSGTVFEKEERGVILDVQGVGYRVAVLGAVLDKMPVGQALSLRIYHQVAEGIEKLYGFTTSEDLHYFELLLTVPSVGPRTAMNILEVAPPRTLEQAVVGNDIKLLTRVAGVGRKTAERILVELKEKIKARKTSGALGDVQSETVSALVNLGFTVTQAREVLQKLPPEVKTVEEAVRVALKRQES